MSHELEKPAVAWKMRRPSGAETVFAFVRLPAPMHPMVLSMRLNSVSLEAHASDAAEVAVALTRQSESSGYELVVPPTPLDIDVSDADTEAFRPVVAERVVDAVRAVGIR